MIDQAFKEKQPFVIGVVGDEPSFQSFMDIFRGREASKTLVEMGLAAVTAPGGKGLRLPIAGGASVPVYESCQEMLKGAPNINMIIELTGNRELVAELRRTLPDSISLVEQAAARFFLGMMTSDKLWVACKLDLLRSQALLKAVIDQINDDILFLNSSGKIMDCNRSIYHNTGKTKDHFLGRDYREVLGFDDSFCAPGDGSCPFVKTLQSGMQSEATYSTVDDSGRMQYYRVYCHPIFDDQGAMVNFVIFRRDITHRTHMEQRVQQAEKLAAIGELSTYIAHEIRNPLFAISGFANSLLRMPELEEAARDKVNIILDESKRLDAILKSILNFSRPTEAKEGVVDVNLAVKSTMDIMRIGCEKQNIEVRLNLAPDLAKASGDTEMIKQCLINLVKNAMEAMPDGGQLTVETATNHDAVMLAVTDTGQGIPPEIRDKIFNPFFSTKGKGAGLGLAMIKKIMDDIGGKLDLASKMGVGTTMTLSLPPLMAVSRLNGD